jgi:hypothetical protein
MSAFSRFPVPFLHPINGSGTPYPAARLNFYVAGSATRLDTYSDKDLTIPNSNPVIADGNGRFGQIFLGSGTYDVTLETSLGANIWTAEDVAASAVSSATTTVAGIVELATTAETLAGASSSLAVTPVAAAAAIQQGFSYGTTGGTANAITVTPTVTPVSLAAGMQVTFRATNNNSGATTLNFGSLGAVSLRLASATGLVALVGGEIISGNTYTVTYSATDSAWILDLVGFTPSTLSLFTALPGVSNLLIVNGGATTNVTITFDQAVLVDANGRGLAVMSGNYTCDCSVSAAINRLDTGSLAANSEYHIWLIAKPDGTLPGSLMSLSATAPTLPTGYVGGFKVRIGCFITGGAATFLRLRQIGKVTQYVVTAGTTTTTLPKFTIAQNASKTALSAAGSVGSGNAQKVPSTALAIRMIISQDGNTSRGVAVFPNNDADYANNWGQHYGAVTGTGTAGQGGCLIEMVLESATIYYIGTNNPAIGAAIAVVGWIDRVNAS